MGRAPGLKQKIWQDEHINLYVLIKPVYQDDDSHSLTLSDEGDVVVQRTSKFQISSITNAIDIIIQLKNNYLQPHLTKLDMKSAFRLPPPPPLSPLNFPLMCIKYGCSYYIDAFLPMGASSCRIFQIFSKAIAYIALSKGNIPFILPYLDDYLLIWTSYPSASHDPSFFTQMASENTPSGWRQDHWSHKKWPFWE